MFPSLLRNTSGAADDNLLALQVNSGITVRLPDSSRAWPIPTLSYLYKPPGQMSITPLQKAVTDNQDSSAVTVATTGNNC